jgi:zinc protease
MQDRASLLLTASSVTASATKGPVHAPTQESTVPGRDVVREVTLANGLKVIVWPVRGIPNVALYNWVRAGSRNEAPGITGLAHFFEHMMFNGTTRRQPGELDRLMEAQGGSNNAFTSDDVTVYQDWFPSRALELVLDLESDRVGNLAFVPQVIESERGVVYSERRLRVEDNNQGLLGEEVQAMAFVAHPYQFPTIGWPSDIQSWDMSDLQSFYRTYYAPNNLTLVLAGDVVPEQVFALARKYFEPLPRQRPPAPIRTREPEQLGERRVVVHRKGQTPLLQCAYKAPAAADPRAPAVNLLLSILVDGDASRLHRRLVEEEEVAIEVSGHWQEGFDPGLFWLYLTLPAGTEPAAAEGVLDAELAAVVRDGVTEAELKRAKSLTEVGFWRKLATIDGKAQLLGEYEIFQGGWSKLFEAPGQYAKVQAAEVHQAAREILDRRRRTVGVLCPSFGDEASEEAAHEEAEGP